jgi:hypothetical protein
MRILDWNDRYLASRTGELKQLKLPRPGFRLRSGGSCVSFDPKGANTIGMTGARNRREAYR